MLPHHTAFSNTSQNRARTILLNNYASFRKTFKVHRIAAVNRSTLKKHLSYTPYKNGLSPYPWEYPCRDCPADTIRGARRGRGHSPAGCVRR